jgi:serine/threonine-protein kinase
VTQQTDRLNTALAGRYRIERQLGEGGMATVYLCEDIKHKRKVALKLLKPELAAVLGAERFVQEITTTAALQHPHILPLFDSGTADGFLFYVMPYIQGETLREKLNRETQLGVDDAVRIARDVADALDYAHRQGVIHRDIKPENILLHDGRPMVADFGIALAVSAAAGGRMTETGLSLGTPHYMSPEQATAEKEITARSDIYSIGSVLYEMLTGNPPFTGAVAQQIIMKIITEPAEAVTKYRKAVPTNVAAAVAKSLEKLPADRFESAKAFAEALGNPAYTNSSGAGATGHAAAASADSRRRVRAREAIAWVIAASGIAAAAYVATRHEPPPVAARLIAELPDSVTLPLIPFTHVAISRDGERLAVIGVKGGTQMVYARSLDDPVLAAVRGTEGAASLALSPDGEWLAFHVRTRGVFKLPIVGGTPQPVGDNADGYSPGWGESGQMVFRNLEGALLLAPADGSKPRRLLALDSAGLSDAPSLLPGGRDVLVSRSARGDRELVLVSTADGSVTDLHMAGFGGSYSAGRVVFSRPFGMVSPHRSLSANVRSPVRPRCCCKASQSPCSQLRARWPSPGTVRWSS